MRGDLKSHEIVDRKRLNRGVMFVSGAIARSLAFFMHVTTYKRRTFRRVYGCVHACA